MNQDKKFKFIDLFAGIGGFRIALESYQGECVYTSEWDAQSQITYKANFGDLPDGDITKVSLISQSTMYCVLDSLVRHLV